MMDIYKEIRFEFDVEKLVRYILSSSENGVGEHDIVYAIKCEHRNYIELP